MTAAKKKTKKPTKKVQAAGLGGVVSAGVVVAVFSAFNIDVSQSVAVLIAGVVTAGLAFASAYLKKS